MEDLSQNIKGRRGHERDVEVEEVVHLPAGGHQSKQQHLGGGRSLIIAIFSSQVVTNPNYNILEGVDAHHCNLLNPAQ